MIGPSSVLFPLTPTLSLGERESLRLRLDHLNASSPPWRRWDRGGREASEGRGRTHLLVAGATLLMLRWPGSAGGGDDPCVSGQGHCSKAAKRAPSCRAARSRARRTAPGGLRGIGTFRRRNRRANSGRSVRQALERDGCKHRCARSGDVGPARSCGAPEFSASSASLRFNPER